MIGVAADMIRTTASMRLTRTVHRSVRFTEAGRMICVRSGFPKAFSAREKSLCAKYAARESFGSMEISVGIRFFISVHMFK